MSGNSEKVDFPVYYKQLVKQQLKFAFWYGTGVVLAAIFLGFYSQWIPAALLGMVGLLLLFVLHWHYTRKYYLRLNLLGQAFPKSWQQFLEDNAAFYAKLSFSEKEQFEQRVQFFLAEKKIEGIDMDIDDAIRMLVAASAIIPTFAFHYYEYSNLRQVLIYPNSFNHSFETGTPEQPISGMVGNGFLNGTLLLSKPDLVAGFKGNNPYNVGIHEFVHLLDMADGAVDGLPEIFLANAYAVPWLQVIKAEIRKIRKGKSDINPYSLTNNAEFLAVVSEYFFDNPEKMAVAHPELYKYLCAIFHQNPR